MISQMTLDEVNENIVAINNASHDIANRLLKIKQCEGWKVLGFASWTKFLESDLFTFSRKHLYELMKATPIKEKLVTKGYRVSNKIASKLSKFPDDLHVPILKTSIERYGGKPTEGEIESVGNVLTTVMLTGHVDLGDGRMTAFEKAFRKEDEERELRQKQHIHDKYEDKPQAPLTLSEIQLAISTITANPSDQSVARAVRSILRIQERKQAG